MTNLNERKTQLENLIASLQQELDLVNQQLENEVVVEVESVETTTIEAKFFEVGKSYEVYLKNSSVKKFECTEADKEKMTVRGKYDNGKVKMFVAEPVWETLGAKSNGEAHVTYSIKVDSRIGLYCTASCEIVE